MELAIFVIMIYRIRNIKDELNISVEVITIMIIWISFSLGYFISLFVSIRKDGYLCPDPNMKLVYQWLNFIFIQLRNIGSLAVSSFFCYKMAKNPHLAYNKDVVSLTTLYDFNTVMTSVLPYSYFRKFIISEQPGYIVHFRMYTLI
jgi:hypothetical protein